MKKVIQETPRIKRFLLSPEEGFRLPAFSAGSHITTYVSGRECHYSLVSSPEDRKVYELAVLLEEGSKGGSLYWHHHIHEGDQVDISDPKNHFPLSDRAKHHIFFAAGIGITPFMAMMAQLRANSGSFELHYAARSKDQCAFYEDIVRQYPGESQFYFSKDNCRMTPEILEKQPIGTHVYFCGPEAMINQFSNAAKSNGYPEGSIHFERFAPKKPTDPKSFEVELKKSGRILNVPEDETLLDVILRAGIRAPYSCRVGECGTCELQVLKGEIDHYDSCLTEGEKREQNVMLACVSRALSSKLVLNV
ncbi:MAG TPA: PDR/VanB family oxidoreductase [Bacillales bacterium]|nr:PDR/VanB family oxidoreductase [Bacillales bacterium]